MPHAARHPTLSTWQSRTTRHSGSLAASLPLDCSPWLVHHESQLVAASVMPSAGNFSNAAYGSFRPNWEGGMGEPVWVVTSELSDGRMVRVDVPAEGEPYESPQRVADGVVRMLSVA